MSGRRRGNRLLATRAGLSTSVGQGPLKGQISPRIAGYLWPGHYCTNLSLLEDEPTMKALFLGTLAASQAMPIIEFITADIRTEILDSNEPTEAAAALADADILLTGAWRSGFPAAPKLRLLQVPLNQGLSQRPFRRTFVKPGCPGILLALAKSSSVNPALWSGTREYPESGSVSDAGPAE